MVSDEALDRVFHALADPTRRAMLRRLGAGELKITDLAAPFPISFAAASKHVKVLEGAGLVSRRIEGRAHLCRIAPGPLQDAKDWLAERTAFWTAQFDALEALIDDGEI